MKKIITLSIVSYVLISSNYAFTMLKSLVSKRPTYVRMCHIKKKLPKIKNNISAMDLIRLPLQQILNDRLCKKGFNHFVEKTKIDATLGNKELYPLGVVMSVECALYDYNKYMKETPIIAVLMEMRKPTIITIILEDHPRAIKQLKENGILIE